MRLEMTRKTDLAIQAFRLLASTGERVPGPYLAQRIDTTVPFLAQIMGALVREGWIDSKRGPNGGYELAVQPGSVSVLAIIEAVEGPVVNDQCVLIGGPCGIDVCSLHDAWSDARAALVASLASRPAIDT